MASCRNRFGEHLMLLSRRGARGENGGVGRNGFVTIFFGTYAGLGDICAEEARDTASFLIDDYVRAEGFMPLSKVE